MYSTLKNKKLVFVLWFVFLISAATMTPTLLPRFTLEKPHKEHSLYSDPVQNPEGLFDEIKSMQKRAERNIKRLERAQIFMPWLPLSFFTFVISGFTLCGLYCQNFLKKAFPESDSDAQ